MSQLAPPLDHLQWAFRCPKCGSAYFGARSGQSPNDGQWAILSYHCHDQFERGCRWSGDETACSVWERVKPQPYPPEAPQPTVADLLAAAEHYQRARDWDGDTAAGEAALHEAGHALQDLCERIAKEGIQ